VSVIINELEVLVAPEQAPQGPGPREPASQEPAPTAFELRALLRHIADRAERVRAD
jgi:hypothetical protein